MKKVQENLLQIENDADALRWIESAMNIYPVSKGFRIETFYSPNFLRLTVYKVEIPLERRKDHGKN